jgi:hypothetical protein
MLHLVATSWLCPLVDAEAKASGTVDLWLPVGSKAPPLVILRMVSAR